MQIPTTMVPPQLPPSTAFVHLPQLSTRILTEENFLQWVALRDAVLGELAHPDFYVREADEKAFFRAHSGIQGQTIGVFRNDALVAYSMVGFPCGNDVDNLAALIGLPEASQSRVTHISSCMVLPEWRGNGMQRTLLAVRLALAQAQGRPHCMAMVSLRNHRSRHNLMRQGMHIAWTGLIDGLQRHVMSIDLQHGSHFDMADELLIPSYAYEALREAAAQGYVGVGELREDGDSVRLRFVRALNHVAQTPR